MNSKTAGLGLGLSVGDEEVGAGGAGLDGLAVLPGQAESDLGVDAKAGGGVDLEGLVPELLLPVIEMSGWRAQRPFVWRM